MTRTHKAAEAGATESVPTPPAGMNPEDERQKLLAARGQGERNRYTMGVHFNNIVTYRFYMGFGYETVEKFVEKELKGEPPVTSLRDWAAVASRFTVEQAVELTCHKLTHLLTYAKKANIEDLSNPGDVPIEFPAEDGTSVTKSLRDCSTTELERLLAQARPLPTVPAELDREARNLQDALGTLLGAESFVRVNIQRRGRNAVIQIDNLQQQEAQRLRELLSQR